jgi:hypothetical protein
LPRGHRLERIHDGRQRVDLDHDQFGGVDRFGAAAGYDDGHGFAHETHALSSKARPGEVRSSARTGLPPFRQVRQRQVGGGEHRFDSSLRSCLGGVDRPQDPVGDVRAHEYQVQSVAEVEVGHEAGSSSQQDRVLEPGDVVAEKRRRRPAGGGRGRRGTFGQGGKHERHEGRFVAGRG